MTVMAHGPEIPDLAILVGIAMLVAVAAAVWVVTAIDRMRRRPKRPVGA